jgi:hypothetical protein
MRTYSRPTSSRWYQNPAIVSPIVKGVCGVIVAAIGYLTVLQQRSEAPPAGSESPAQVTPAASSLSIVAPAATPQSQAPTNLLLNFAAFQEQFATPEINPQERDLRIRQFLQQRVVWKGYVDAITPVSTPTDEAAVTVSLVESQSKLGQSMFKTPAHCRFGRDALDTVATLTPGDLVTISGTFAGHSLIATEITAAHLLSVYDSTLPATASGPEQGTTR